MNFSNSTALWKNCHTLNIFTLFPFYVNFSFNCTITSPWTDLSLLSLSNLIFSFSWFLLIFLNISFAFLIWDNISVTRATLTWEFCSRKKQRGLLNKTVELFLFIYVTFWAWTHSEPEKTTASFPKLLSKSAVDFLCISYLNTGKLIYHPVQHRSQAHLRTCTSRGSALF